MWSGTRPGSVLEEGDEQQVSIAGAQAALQVAETRDGAVLQRVPDRVQVVAAEVVVEGGGERPVGEPEGAQHRKRDRERRDACSAEAAEPPRPDRGAAHPRP